MSNYFIAPDAYGDMTLWRRTDGDPVAVLVSHLLDDDPRVWALLAAAYGEDS